MRFRKLLVKRIRLKLTNRSSIMRLAYKRVVRLIMTKWLESTKIICRHLRIVKLSSSQWDSSKVRLTSLYLLIYPIIIRTQFSQHRTKPSLYSIKPNSSQFSDHKIQILQLTNRSLSLTQFYSLNKKQLIGLQRKTTGILKKRQRLMLLKSSKNQNKLSRNLTLPNN